MVVVFQVRRHAVAGQTAGTDHTVGRYRQRNSRLAIRGLFDAEAESVVHVRHWRHPEEPVQKKGGKPSTRGGRRVPVAYRYGKRRC